MTGYARKATFTSIPTINLSALYGDDPSKMEELAKEVSIACRDVGFFRATCHGVDEDVIQTAFKSIKQFFALPEEEKAKVHFYKSVFGRGYESPFDTRHEAWGKGDMKEAFSYSDLDTDPARNQWPTDQPEFKAALVAYYAALVTLAQRLEKVLALALGLPQDYFTQTYKYGGAAVRMLRYPPQPEQRDTDEIGIGAHTDHNWFTFIFQDGSGLEVQNENGEWIPMPPQDGSLVVNFGDSMQWVSGGKIRSTRHRVMNGTENSERYSMAFFYNPSLEDVLRVAPTCQEGSPFQGELGVEEYFKMRQAGSRMSHPLLKQQK